MKCSDVPQDAAILGQWCEIVYSVDEQGNYVLTPSAGWEASNLANLQAWQTIAEKIEAALVQIQAGKASPLAFHMARNQMDVGLLASYVGLPRWRVKRHLKAASYRRLPARLRARYASVFRVSDEALDLVPERVELPVDLARAEKGPE